MYNKSYRGVCFVIENGTDFMIQGGSTLNSVLTNNLFEAFASSSDNVYVYVSDLKTGLSRWSKNAVEYFDFPGEYMQDVIPVIREKIHPEDWEGYFADLDKVFSGKQDRHSYQYRLRNRYGDYVWIECKGSIIRENGEPVIFAGLMTRLDTQNKYDSVTGLSTIFDFYNYDFNGKTGYLLLVGIDQFRKVVSNYGYQFGDRVLVEFSKKLRTLCEPDARLYRMNGDEFLIIAENTDEVTLFKFFECIKESVEELELEGGRKLHLSITAGACAFPADGTNKEDLLNNAEHSLEYCKSTRRGELLVFSKTIADSQLRIQTLKDELKQSIKNDFKGFTLFFQPIVDGERNRIIGCEALLRWQGETIKDSYPGEFIKILEDDGNIIPVGRWVMREAVKQQSIWDKDYPGIIVSFNVSYQQFVADRFIEDLMDAVEENGVDPSHMIVELTESCKVEKSETLAEIFRHLKNEGYRVALDDFGTAYASLEMLRNLPASIIKIEHSFVRELADPGHDVDYVIIDSLLTMCRKLNCNAIVEGVESEKVAAMIKELDTTMLQGYYYSKPVPRSEFEKMLESQK